MVDEPGVFSLTKVRVEQDDVRRIVNAHLKSDDAVEVTELKDGHFNSAFLVSTKAGFKAVIKIAPSKSVRILRYEADVLHAEVTVLRLIAGSAPGIPVPLVYAADEQVTDPALKQTLEQQFGALLRKLHDIPLPAGTKFGLATPSAPHFDTWREAFSAMIGDLLADAADEPTLHDKIPLARVRAVLEKISPVLEDVKEPRLLMWDSWDGNVMVDGDKVTGLFDFERAIYGDPLMEFAFFRPSEALTAGYGRLWGSTSREVPYRQLNTGEDLSWREGALNQVLAMAELWEE
ncbi:kinase-like domain-containing protein [Cladochytrium replicatum]|nr:kinase-like domain-containing protein [Cladochytrium replicatum]